MKEGLVSPTSRAVSRLRTALEQENTVREVANISVATLASQWVIKSGAELSLAGGPLNNK
jgi:hypothetical protein